MRECKTRKWELNCPPTDTRIMEEEADGERDVHRSIVGERERYVHRSIVFSSQSVVLLDMRVSPNVSKSDCYWKAITP
eukprot:5126348-Ditylum_brightwellii.AAC.2